MRDNWVGLIGVLAMIFWQPSDLILTQNVNKQKIDTQMVYHKFRELTADGLKGAQMINAESDGLLLDKGDSYVLNGRAYVTKASFLYEFSGLVCYLYVIEHDPELQEIIDFIGL